MATQRPWREVPRLLPGLLGVLLLTLCLSHSRDSVRGGTARALPAAPSTAWLELLSGGDSVLAARLLMVWLQAFDTQPGLSLPLVALDYAQVEAWLAQALLLDPRAQSPLLAASRLYSQVPDPVRAARMLDFVHAQFARDPARRWPWLAHAVWVAQHRLRDAARAQRYAHTLSAASDPAIPAWAQQMEIFVLEGTGEVARARVLLTQLLASGTVRDAHEYAFLSKRLAQMLPAEKPVGESSQVLK
jgi:hypothetical protein